MPKYTMEVTIQIDVDSDTGKVIGLPEGLSDPGYAGARDWDGEEVDDSTSEMLCDLLPNLDWRDVLKEVR